MSSALGQGIRIFDVREAERMLPLIRVIVKGMMDDHAERQALLNQLAAVDAWQTELEARFPGPRPVITDVPR